MPRRHQIRAEYFDAGQRQCLAGGETVPAPLLALKDRGLTSASFCEYVWMRFFQMPMRPDPINTCVYKIMVFSFRTAAFLPELVF